MIHNFSIAWPVLSRKHGLATFIHEHLKRTLVHQSPEHLDTECLCVDVTGYKIINLYKPPSSRPTPTTIPTFSHPSPFVGDFNCQHVNWAYNNNIPRRREPGFMGRNQQLLSAPQTNWRSQFHLSPIEHRHQPGPGLRLQFHNIVKRNTRF